MRARYYSHYFIRANNNLITLIKLTFFEKKGNWRPFSGRARRGESYRAFANRVTLMFLHSLLKERIV
jgi:hypothetical protein